MSDDPKETPSPPTYPVVVDYTVPAEILASVASDHRVPTASLKTLLRKVYKKNWWLITIYIVVNLIGIVGSYFMQGYPSVALAVLVSITTTVIGFFAIVVTVKAVTAS
jgi:hypothetical protein